MYKVMLCVTFKGAVTQGGVVNTNAMEVPAE
jgi:hypothetical protein